MKSNGAVGGGAFTLGNLPASDAPPSMYLTADAYNSLWLSWGLLQRPTNYDQAIAQRWGAVIGQERNPYPLPGEDPNRTNGGSGQLPRAMTQLREADGRWSGKLALTCHMCHSGQVGIAGEADPLIAPNIQNALDWIERNDQDATAWIMDLRSPKYPDPIDTALAEQGAILFHNKDLFAMPGNAGRERPKGGNGSCAGCHGAYSPRFVNDPDYLETPALEGIAGYIVPRNLIGTDPRRVDGNDQEVAQTFERDWFGYPEQAGTENDCGDQNLDRIRGERENGYLAPPLYGVWATAPYFHNGSVPNVWEVLKSADRKPFWRRVSAPNDTGQNLVMGFDSSFRRAYDQQKLGWKYEAIACGLAGAMPYVECDPADPQANPLLDQVLSASYANGGFAWNVPNLVQIPLTNAHVEERRLYSTRIYSQSNAGHDFADVLTDQERLAIIEYLKTL